MADENKKDDVTISGNEEITVCWSEEKFSPIAYNSFGIGGFYFRTKIQPDETPEQAFDRGWEFLDKMARKHFASKLKGFNERWEEAMGNNQPSPQQNSTAVLNEFTGEYAGEKPANQNTESRFPANPIAKSLPDLITAKQLGMIRNLCREMQIDENFECATLMDCKTDELSKKAASSFIQYLQDMQKEREQSVF